MSGKPLSAKQKAFVDAYMGAAKGNAAEAVRMAEYGCKTPATQAAMGSRLLTSANIAAAIAERQQQVASSRIMTIEQMQEMLTQIAARNAEEDPQVAINAVKELGKMQGAYIDRSKIELDGEVKVEQKGTVSVKGLSREALLELKAKVKTDD